MSVSSYLATTISYLQGLGMAAGSEDMNLPEPIHTVVTAVLHAFAYVSNSIPRIPNFDVRTELAILGVGIPAIVYILLVWFLFSTSQFLISMFDLAAVALAAGFLAWGFTPNYSFGEALRHIHVAVIAGARVVYLVIRLIVKILRWRKEEENALEYRDAAREVCKYFLYNFCPEIQVNITTAQLQKVLKSQQVEPLTPARMQMSSLGTGVRVTIILILVAGGLWVLRVFELPWIKLGPIWALLGYFALPIAFILIIHVIMAHTACGRRGLVRIWAFGRRWGLRLLLLILDIAFIPTIEALITLLVWTNEEPCPAMNVYTFPNVSGMGFVELEGWCSPCIANCRGACAWPSAIWLRRELGAPPLRYYTDILAVSGPMEAYVVVCVLFGLPVLWLLLIHENSIFMWSIKIWGSGPGAKWRALIGRMNTNGLTLFADYQHHWKNWAVWILAFKFVVMLIATISKYQQAVAYALPGLYVLWLIFTAVQGPYLFKFNTIIDCLFYAFNAAFLLFPLISHHVQVPTLLIVVVALCCLALPVIGLVFLFCCRRQNELVEEGDLTLPKPLDAAELEYRKEHLYDERKQWVLDKYKVDHDEAALRRRMKLIEEDGLVFDGAKAVECFDWNDLDAAARRKRTDFMVLGDQSQFFRERDTEEVEYHMLDSIEECGDMMERRRGSKGGPVQVEDMSDSDDSAELLSSEPQEEPPKEKYRVNRMKLAATCTKLYEELDALVDVSTMHRTATMLGGAVMIGFLTAGWWFGSVWAKGSALAALVPEFPTCAHV